MTANQRIETLIQIASRLIELLDTEVGHLRAMRMAEVAALQPEKAALTGRYEAAVAAMRAAGDSLTAVAPALQREFRRVAAGLETAARANGQALVAARVAHDRLLRCIVEAVEARNKPAAGYGRPGKAPAMRPTAPRPLSLTLNRTT